MAAGLAAAVLLIVPASAAAVTSVAAPTSANSSPQPAAVSQRAEHDVEYVCSVSGPDFEQTVRATVTSPSSARQGEQFMVEVAFSFATLSGFTYEASGTLLRAAASGGDDLVSAGPGNWTGDRFETTPAVGTFSVWGDVGETMDFHAGRVIITTFWPYFGVPPSTATCDPVAGSAPVLSVPIEPPADGGPITDELGITVVAADGAVLYERRAFLESGDFAASRHPYGAVESLIGGGTYDSVRPASVSLLSGVPRSSSALAPATILSVSDPAAGVILVGFSGVPHKSSGMRESIAGFAIGLMEGQSAPVGVYWFVRDLA